MPVEIDSMRSSIEILPSNDSSESRPAASSVAESGAVAAQGQDRLKEQLRPLLMELMEEELENYMRIRG